STTRPRFLNHADYDPLWAEFERLGVTACIHPAAGGTNAEWTSTGAYVERVAAPVRTGHAVAESIAPMMDNAILLNAFCFYAHLARSPRLRWARPPWGGSWVRFAGKKGELFLWLLRI